MKQSAIILVEHCHGVLKANLSGNRAKRFNVIDYNREVLDVTASNNRYVGDGGLLQLYQKSRDWRDQTAAEMDIRLVKSTALRFHKLNHTSAIFAREDRKGKDRTLSGLCSRCLIYQSEISWITISRVFESRL